MDERRPHPSGVVGGMATLVALLAAGLVLGRTAPDGTAEVRTRPLIGHRVDLNRAGARELAILPEIGPSTAKAIIEDRAARGPFASVTELTRVRGIGPATVEAITPHATVGGE